MDCYASSHTLLMQHSYSSSSLKASLEYMTEGMPIFLQWLFCGNLTYSDSVVIHFTWIDTWLWGCWYFLQWLFRWNITQCVCDSIVVRFTCTDASIRTMPYFFDQTPWLLFFSLLVFLWLLFGGSVYFFGKSVGINDGWIKYAQAFIQDFELGEETGW